MAVSTVIDDTQAATSNSALRLRIAFAFFAIYFLWGSTYLSIRIAVATVPPLFAAGIRFVIAGVVLYAWSRLRGVPEPNRTGWRNLSIMGALMFVAPYAGLFWAEKTIPSGVASVLVATIPLFTALFEIFIFKKESLQLSLVGSIALGLVGVITLVSAPAIGRANLLPCLAILGAEISWSFGTVLSKNLYLPESKLMSSGGQMLTGGLMLLLISFAIGELHPFPHISLRAGAAIAYLIVAGSLVAFTAYMWLLGRMPTTKVASYAYVNPVVALAFGWWLGGESITPTTLVGTALVLVSVVLLLRRH